MWGCVKPPSIYFNERRVADKVDLVHMDFGINEIIHKTDYRFPGSFECHLRVDHVNVKDDGSRWKEFTCTCLPEDNGKFDICWN